MPQSSRPTSSRRTLVCFAFLAVAVCGALAYVVSVAVRDPVGPDRDWRVMADQLDFWETAADFSAGKLESTRLATAPAAGHLILADSKSRFPREGVWTSAEIRTSRHFTELLPSFNANCPKDTGLRIDLRVRDAHSNAWSAWYFLGDWGRTPGRPERVTRTATGRVSIDILTLERPAEAYQVRLSLYSFSLDPSVNPTVRRLAVCTSGTEPLAGQRSIIQTRAGGAESPAAASAITPGATVPDDVGLPVPFRAQGASAEPLRPEICSPTSVAMVMEFWGINRPTEEHALAVYDDRYDLFGNWGRAVAWAGQNGLDAWLTRFRSWQQVRATLAAGQPIIASIRFARGQCPSFVLKESRGHLIVIRGFTPAGDLIVNDPASKSRGDGAIYNSGEMEAAWLAKGGVGYVIRR